MNDESRRLVSKEPILSGQHAEEATSSAGDAVESGVESSIPRQLFLRSLSIWERQIGNVTDQIKHAIGDLASRFSTLTMDIEKAVDASRRSTEETTISDDGDKGTIVDLFNQTETELGAVITALNDAQQEKLVLVREFREFSRFTKELDNMSELVAKNARMTTILSLNAMIEAARAGDHGKGFAIVAQEVRDLSISSADTGKRISEMVADFNTAMDSVVDLTEKNAQSDEASIAASESTIRAVMSRFRAVTSSLVDSSSEMQETGENIGKEISGMLVSLQFQDRVSQILEHVTRHMAMLRDRIDEVSALDSDASASGLADLESWLAVMETTYVTGEQRLAHEGVDDLAAVQPQVAFF